MQGDAEMKLPTPGNLWAELHRAWLAAAGPAPLPNEAAPPAR